MKPTIIRLPHRVKLNKTSIILTGITICAILYAILGNTNQKMISTSKNLNQIKVLILYSSGNPTFRWKTSESNISEDVDAITSPTSKFVNTTVLAEIIANYLKKEMLIVTLRRIDEIKRLKMYYLQT